MWPLKDGRFFGLQLLVAGVPPGQDLFERIVSVATAAEDAGFSTITVMDHFHQPQGMGRPADPVLEAYTLLGAIAARTKKAWLGTLVTGVSHRNPAILAKQVTTLDVISGGRALLGLGAGWYVEECKAYGIDFPKSSVRRRRVEEAVEICRAMFAGEKLVLEGEEYRVDEPLNQPLPVQPGGIPVLLGTSGGPKMIELIARLADVANLTSGFDVLPEHLALMKKSPRTRGDLITSGFGSLIIGDTRDDAMRKRDEFVHRAGLPSWDDLSDTWRDVIGRWMIGTEDEVATRLKAMFDMGLNGLTVDLRAEGLDVDAVKRAARVLAQAAS